MPRHDNDRGLALLSMESISQWINQKATPGRFDWIPCIRGPYSPSANTTISDSDFTAITGLSQELTFKARMRVVVDVFANVAVTTAPISGLRIRAACSPTAINTSNIGGYLMVGDTGIFPVNFRSVYDVPANVPYTFSVEAALEATASGEVVFPDESTYMTITAFPDTQFR